MRVVELVGTVTLQAVGEAAAINIRSNTIEDKIADRVRNEMQCAVTGEGGELKI